METALSNFTIMKYMISLKEIESIIQHAVNLGRIEVTQIFVPDTKTMSRPQVIKYIKTMGYEASDLDRWECNGLITHSQAFRNCTRKYLAKDVEELMLKIITKQSLGESMR